MTGLPRALFGLFGTDETFLDPSLADRLVVSMVQRSWNFAGVRRLPYVDNVLATALRNNVLDVLSNDGFDLFVMRHGKIRASDGTLQAVPLHDTRPTMGGYEALRPNSVDARGNANNLILLSSGLEGDLPFNGTAQRWRDHFYVLRKGTGTSKAKMIQNLLVSVYHMSECNARVKEYAARTGTVYEYKMRLRTDMLFLARIPSLRTLNFGTPRAPIIHGTTTDIMRAWYDKFAVGRAAPMDTYLDRYPLLHDGRIKRWQRLWNAEWFLCAALTRVNARVVPNEAIQATVVRSGNFSRRAQGMDRLANIGRRRRLSEDRAIRTRCEESST